MHEKPGTPEMPPQKFASPEEEIAYLRRRIAERERTLDAASPEATRHTYESLAKDELGRYGTFTPQSVLKKKYQLEGHQLASTIEQVETARDQIGEIMELAETRGIRNALSVLEKVSSAYVNDEVHRRLIQQIKTGRGIADFKEGAPLWNVLHMTLFQVMLPELQKEDEREDTLKTVVSSMEQFYAGMQSIAGSARTPQHFAIEIAISDKSDDIIFFVAVPTVHIDLFEKQLLSLFPHAELTEQKNDYNIFIDGGIPLVATATLAREPLYPIRTYEEFEHDPLHVILNAFSKIEKEGGGASVQLVIRPGENRYRSEYKKVIDRIEDGMSTKKAIRMATFSGEMLEAFKDIITSSGKKKEGNAFQFQTPEIDTDAVEQFEKKIDRPIFTTNIRIAVSSEQEIRARQILGEIVASFHQFENTNGNKFLFKELKGNAAKHALRAFSFREYQTEYALPFSIAELATLVHFPVRSIHFSPQFKQTRARAAAAPIDLPTAGTLLGTNTYRNKTTDIYVTEEDRLRHFYIIGQTGTGKTTLMKNMIIQDIEAGNGVCMIDPHGTDIIDVLAAVPPERENDIIYFDPAYTERSVGLNMLEYDAARPEQKTFVVNELFSIFQKLYGAVPESMGPMFEQYFRNATMLVLEDPESGSTLMDISRVLADPEFRRMKLSRAKNPVVVQFWEEIASRAGGEASLENIVPYITSKFDVFTANDYMRPIIGQQHSSFNFRQIMDEQKILLVNLSKGRLGEINANLIGMIIVGKLLMAALSRVDDMSHSLPPFYLHMDEFQNVTTNSITAILSEARKYKLGLTVAHQYIAQLEESIRDAVFGNVGSVAAFRVGPEDAEFLERQFAPTFNAYDLMNIENRNAYVRLLADGTPTKSFNIKTSAPREVNYDAASARMHRLYTTYGRSRQEVEAEISARYQRRPLQQG